MTDRQDRWSQDSPDLPPTVLSTPSGCLIPQSTIKSEQQKGQGEATLSQFDGPLETEIEPREPPSLNSAVPTPTSSGLFSQFQLRHFYLFFLFLETHLEMKPFITAHPQTVCGSIIDNESAAKK